MEDIPQASVAKAGGYDSDASATATAITAASKPSPAPSSASSSISKPQNKTPRKRKATGVGLIRTSSMSKKIPDFMSKTTKWSVTYFTMILEAILELNDRTGSSIPAIAKYMKAKHPELLEVKHKVFNTAINAAIKAAMKESKLIKVRCSYKVNKDWINKGMAEFKARENKKKLADKKKKKDEADARKKKELAMKKEKVEKEKLKKEMEATKKKKEMEKVARMTEQDKRNADLKKQQKIEATKKKEDDNKRAKELEDKIKKRRFPMDDLALIVEDKKLGVKKPPEVTRAPFLPYALTSLLPHGKDNRPTTKKSTMTSVITACSTDVGLGNQGGGGSTSPTTVMSMGTRTGYGNNNEYVNAGFGAGSRGLISDVVQIYHFFRGDLDYSRIFQNTIPEFSFRHLLHAVNEIVLGNARKSRVVPPLLSYLFLLTLNVLTTPDAEDWVGGDYGEVEGNQNSSSSGNRYARRWDDLKADCTKLNGCLTDCSWGETLLCYIQVMETFYTTDASTDENALPGHSIVMEEEEEENDPDQDSTIEDVDMSSDENDQESDLPTGYYGYLGPENSATRKAYHKLLRQDPWHLTAEELISLLRILCDDILAMKPSLAKEIAVRDEKLWELLKAKKAAESHFRKIRLAYEGPKQKSKAKKVTTSTDGTTDAKNEKEGGERKFVPTATKAEFDEATKSRDKAVAQYDKNVKLLVHRSKPIGYDKNYNPIYYFHHNPQSLYIEVTKCDECDPFNQTKSWHCIDSKQLFDDYVSSLDLRGSREGKLYERLMGESGTGSSTYRRHLYSSNQKDSLIASRKREEEEFERKMNNAIIANAESSRRSGRLASNAKDEVSRIQEEMDEAKLRFEVQLAALETVDDYSTLSGITLLSDFERKFRLSARCSQLWNNGDERNRGIIGKIAQDMLELEEVCNTLSPWNTDDDSDEEARLKWRINIEDTADAWHNGCALHIGPKTKPSDFNDDPFSPNKKQRLSLDGKSKQSSSASVSFEYALSSFKGPLIELEKRIYSILGLERAVQEVDEANENVSVETDGSEGGNDEKEAERRERANYAWKKKIWSLHAIPARRASAIRDVLISAIAIARKASISDALEDLRGALQLHRPGGGGRARTAALAILDKYGFEKKDDDDEGSVDGDDGTSEVESIDDASSDDSKRTSFLSAEAMMLSGSLEGDDHADRVDWKDAVTVCRTVSRFASLVASLKSRASPRLDKLLKDKKTLSKAITYWETNGKTRKGKSKKNTSNSRKFHSATEIWADVKPTDQFVMSKVEGFPWWPARVCTALDDEVAQSLDSINRTMVAFLGEQHLYTVDKDTEVKALTLSPPQDDGVEYGPEISKNLKNSVNIARGILRGRGVTDSTEDLTGMNVDIEHLEEKKSAS